MTDHRPAIETFLSQLGAGKLDPSNFTEDFSASTTTSGRMEGARYLGAGRLLAALFDGGYRFVIESITQQDDRAAVEVEGGGKFRDGASFANSYLFMFRFNDGKIASVAEHFDPRPVESEIVPRIKALMAKQQENR